MRSDPGDFIVKVACITRLSSQRNPANVDEIATLTENKLVPAKNLRGFEAMIIGCEV
jgi:hypothetical protein